MKRRKKGWKWTKEKNDRNTLGNHGVFWREVLYWLPLRHHDSSLWRDVHIPGSLCKSQWQGQSLKNKIVCKQIYPGGWHLLASEPLQNFVTHEASVKVKLHQRHMSHDNRVSQPCCTVASFRKFFKFPKPRSWSRSFISESVEEGPIYQYFFNFPFSRPVISMF